QERPHEVINDPDELGRKGQCLTQSLKAPCCHGFFRKEKEKKHTALFPCLLSRNRRSCSLPSLAGAFARPRRRSDTRSAKSGWPSGSSDAGRRSRQQKRARTRSSSARTQIPSS